MTDPRDSEYRRTEAERHEHRLEEGAAPSRVGVYERPERTTPSPAVIAILAIVLLIIAAVVVVALIL